MPWFLLKYAIPALVAGFATWWVMLQWHDNQVHKLETKHEQALTKALADASAQCLKEKQLTTEVSNGLQTQLSDLRSQLAAAKRVRPQSCAPVVTRPTSGHDGQAGNTELPDPHGITSDALLDFAYDAEVVGRQLDSCQEFVSKVWKLNHQ